MDDWTLTHRNDRYPVFEGGNWDAVWWCHLSSMHTANEQWDWALKSGELNIDSLD